jgi:hypothetical protein
MTDKTYLVRFKPREIGLQTVIAARAEIHGEHIVLLDTKGKLAALFLMEIVESWSVLGIPAGAGGMSHGAPWLTTSESSTSETKPVRRNT